MAKIEITSATAEIRSRVVRNPDLEAALAQMKPGTQFAVPTDIDDRTLRSAVSRASRIYARVVSFRTGKTKDGARVVVADKPQ